ncbi:MAG: coiled-coil domain-containing protein [Bacteroidales bacterium]
MKTKLWVIILAIALPLAWGCKQKEIQGLSDENSRLLAETLKKDSTINLLFQAFNEIEENLEMIKAKQSIISQDTKGNPELSGNTRDRINEDIQLINELMIKNKKKIAQLNKKLKDANLKMDEFQKTIDRMTRQIEEKETEINSLKENLVKMNFKVEELNKRVDTLVEEGQMKDQVIESKTAELNTAYYVYGTSKELREKGILTKTGGFIGIGRDKKLMEDFNKSYFTKVDVTKFSEIPLNCKKAKLITTHGSDSYKFEMEGKKVSKLVISNPSKFWEASKYMVIEIE